MSVLSRPSLRFARAVVALVNLTIATYITVQVILLLIGGGQWGPPSTDRPTLTLDVLQALGLLVALTALLITVTVMIASRCKRIYRSRVQFMLLNDAADATIAKIRAVHRKSDAEWKALKDRLDFVEERSNALSVGRIIKDIDDSPVPRKNGAIGNVARMKKALYGYMIHGVRHLEYRSGSWVMWAVATYVCVHFGLRCKWAVVYALDFPDTPGLSVVVVGVQAVAIWLTGAYW